MALVPLIRPPTRFATDALTETQPQLRPRTITLFCRVVPKIHASCDYSRDRQRFVGDPETTITRE